MPVSEIDVDALAALDTERIQLVDVRERDEFEQARVPGAVLIPLMTIPEKLEHLENLGEVCGKLGIPFALQEEYTDMHIEFDEDYDEENIEDILAARGLADEKPDEELEEEEEEGTLLFEKKDCENCESRL